MKRIRGTYDLFYQEMNLHNEVVEVLKKIVQTAGFSQIKTPIFENTELFKRSTGESSDIVQKEMYDFLDKGRRKLTLRPELTAGTVRAFNTNKLFGLRLPQYKFFYYGEVFRYERPQSLRYRQFYQFGIEFFGETSIYSDLETIALGDLIIKQLDLTKKTTLKINTIGSSKEREKYNQQLYKYFNKDRDQLCEDCQKRLELNPLKVLDCKIDGNKKIVQDAPKLSSSLGEESLVKFEKIKFELDKLKIEYKIDESLVRGLDYYNDIVFEFEYAYPDENKTIIGGGRYDNLVEKLDGPSTPAIGFGIGVERIIEAIKERQNITEIEELPQAEIFFATNNEKNHQVILQSMVKLREAGLVCYGDYGLRSFKSQYKLAQKMKAIYLITFEDGLNSGEVKIKNLITKEENIAPLKDFEEDVLEETK